MAKENIFEQLNSVDCSTLTKKKSKFDYLAYALGIEIARKKGYDTRYEVVKNPLSELTVFGNPEQGYMVLVNTTVGDKTLPMWLPVADNKNNAIKQPNVANINKAIMRCVAKGLACFGVGAHVYEGYSNPCVMPKVANPDFVSLSAIDVTPYVEKTYSGAEYLQWMKAIHLLLVNYPEASWEIVPCSANGELWETTPFGTMVTVSVKLSEDSLPYVVQRPVLNSKNGADMNADVCAINTAIMRCLTKAISFATGIGISLYAGEEYADETSAMPTADANNATKPSKGKGKKKEEAKAEKEEQPKPTTDNVAETETAGSLEEKMASISEDIQKKLLSLYKKSSIDEMSEVERNNLLQHWDMALAKVS